MMPHPARVIPVAARAGAILAALAWLIAFTAFSVPHTLRFAPQLAGGLVLSAAVAVLVDWVLRRAPLLPFSLWGALCLGVALIGGYWVVAVEPALFSSPHTVARLVRMKQATHGLTLVHLPKNGLLVAAFFALPLLGAAWVGHQAKRHRMR